MTVSAIKMCERERDGEKNEREMQTPEVFLSILLNQSTDQYRYKLILETVCRWLSAASGA